MRGRRLRLVVVGPLALAAGVILAPAPAPAQPVTCPAPGDNAASVVVATPEPGATVSGRVEVKGRVEAPTPLFQIELFVGDSRKDFIALDPPVEATDFTLTWDVTTARGGPSTLHVVACGGSTELGRLIQGTASFEVQVDASASPASLVPLVEADDVGTRRRSSIAAGAVIAIPAAACLLYAMGRRRSSPSSSPPRSRP